jgi:isoleucyl-tRNA synthetase
VNRIQKIRKDSGFELTDRISVKISGHPDLMPAITQFKSYICAEILADQLDVVPDISEGFDVEFNEHLLKVNVSKKGG